jgi:hypothetical protein
MDSNHDKVIQSHFAWRGTRRLEYPVRNVRFAQRLPKLKLYKNSHGPTRSLELSVDKELTTARPAGLEPTTHGLEIRRTERPVRVRARHRNQVCKRRKASGLD